MKTVIPSPTIHVCARNQVTIHTNNITSSLFSTYLPLVTGLCPTSCLAASATHTTCCNSRDSNWILGYKCPVANEKFACMIVGSKYDPMWRQRTHTHVHCTPNIEKDTMCLICHCLCSVYIQTTAITYKHFYSSATGWVSEIQSTNMIERWETQ